MKLIENLQSHLMHNALTYEHNRFELLICKFYETRTQNMHK
jgi:hypothetical protein